MGPSVISPVFLLVLLVLCCISKINGANILCLFTSPGRSHMIIDMAIAKPLIDKGHNVTIVTTMDLKDNNPKYNHIFLPPSEKDYAEYHRILSTAMGQSSLYDTWRDIFWANVERVRIQDKAIKHPRFKEFLENPGNKFDVVILGWVFNTYQLGIAAHFKCPVIVSFHNHPSPLIAGFTGTPSPLATVNCIFSYDLLCFKNRLRNMFFALLWGAFEEFGEYKMAQYYDEYFSDERYPPYDEMKKNVSLVFCASHFVDGRIRALTPSFIEIGGIQIKEKSDPLPKDVEEFIETANNGFIFFSLGTNVKTADISPNATLAIFKVLSQSKYKVLWKWDDTDPPGKSPNIMFRKWFPQDDLLANSKLKLFISHAGKGSSVEVQYHGVPMLAIPVYGDQFGNAKEIAAEGYGVIVNHWNVTEESFRKDFYEILENPKYLKAVRKYSQKYRDRPMSPRESVVYWTEYVIRHRGAKHMQSPVIHLNFFQKNSLDVLAVLVVVLYVSFVIIRKI
ncbi:UDP-glycosyltransferase UGT5-like, partial [Episyrphus balteatus]|uniref:UDP-glycosyltransferase UGT5-like n=1 Tax=Episyrphus balteatus TaxID=286459 RepID=UPI00248624EE